MYKILISLLIIAAEQPLGGATVSTLELVQKTLETKEKILEIDNNIARLIETKEMLRQNLNMGLEDFEDILVSVSGRLGECEINSTKGSGFFEINVKKASAIFNRKLIFQNFNDIVRVGVYPEYAGIKSVEFVSLSMRYFPRHLEIRIDPSGKLRGFFMDTDGN